MQLRVLATLLCLAACDETVSAGKPVGVTVDTEAEIQRYLRRAYLDLSGVAPTEPELAAGTTRLRDGGNTAAVRGQLVDELLAGQAFAAAWADELQATVFAGDTLENHYQFVCILVAESACATCAEADQCRCPCEYVQPYLDERTRLEGTAAALLAGTSTSSLERRHASAIGYYLLAESGEARVEALFDDFLARTAEPDEIENGRTMIFGGLTPGAPAGLMFHRHGGSYDDLLDIIFKSEVYREALVRRVFDRYLARSPNSLELVHFTATIDANEPDSRGLVRAVVSSREYFDQ